MNQFLEVSQKRRTIYALNKEVKLSQDQINNLIQAAIKHSPSSFNSQSSRAVILFNESHNKLWNIVTNTLRKIVPAENFAATEAKIASFAAGHGTVLFFEDADVITQLQQKFATYAANFPIWSQQSAGMAQYSVWTALACENIGASLQHYNELIEAEVTAEWNLPKNWKLLAQMPFGGIAHPAGDKEFMNDAERFKRFG